MPPTSFLPTMAKLFALKEDSDRVTQRQMQLAKEIIAQGISVKDFLKLTHNVCCGGIIVACRMMEQLYPDRKSANLFSEVTKINEEVRREAKESRGEVFSLWLDDMREMPNDYTLHCRTAEEAIVAIKAKQVYRISFDHDLGEGLTGYDVAKVIEEMAFRGEIPPIKWTVHSANPVGKQNIVRAMQSAERFWGMSLVD